MSIRRAGYFDGTHHVHLTFDEDTDKLTIEMAPGNELATTGDFRPVRPDVGVMKDVILHLMAELDEMKRVWITPVADKVFRALEE